VAPAKTKVARAKKAPVTATNVGAPREGSKTSQVIEMLKREGGVTLEELMAKFQWQAHTTRSMLSAGGPLAKKHGLLITSDKIGDQRTYSIKA
jgi:DeoR/GlpR family transcriptional regulator of sugar metabolism